MKFNYLLMQTLVSFGIMSFFTSISGKECLGRTELLLYNSKVDVCKAIELLDVIEVGLKQNYFQYQNYSFEKYEELWGHFYLHC